MTMATQAADAPPLTLLTFAPMVDSELCRLVLAHYAVAYRESPHVFGWGSILSLWHGWTPVIPLLYGNGFRLSGPRSIVNHYEDVCSHDKMLVPSQQPLRTHVEDDWNLYNGELALYTAVVAYFHLLPHPDILTEVFFRGVPAEEVRVFGHTYPLQRLMFETLLRLNPARAQDALARIRTIFAITDKRIADGRRYLAGDTLTLSDLSLAAAAASLLLPDGYAAPIPPFEVMPAEMKAIITEMRGHPTAGFVQRIYSEQPRPVTAHPAAP
jgi:glutathione S-transferase